jgi:hypothetical protein
MHRTPVHRLLDRGRKAGVNAAELYRAISSRPPAIGECSPGQTDCNGYVSQVGANGQRTYLPHSESSAGEG